MPIDWNGAFGVETTRLENFRRVETREDVGQNLSMVPDLASGEKRNATWQSYIFQLNPTLLINDAASIKGEFTSGYGRGGVVGRSSTQNQTDDFANALYYHNTSDGENSIVINQLYAEIYADTATYRLGRHSAHWGLGAVYNDGSQLWDRHFSMREGVTMDLKLGNFFFQPFWSKVSQGSSLTRATNIKEWGVSLLYDNPQQDMSFGVLYGVKQSKHQADGITQDISDSGSPAKLGETNVKIIDLYFHKDFGSFDFSVEVPIMSGELGNFIDSKQITDYKARAILFESNWNLSDRWTLGFDAGRVSGHGGDTRKFEAMYLHPNYHVGEILFRYNLHAIADDSLNIYDSYVTNANYYKIRADYLRNKWTWHGHVLMAKADEAAREGELSFQHETNRQAVANANQSDNLGVELNFGFNYQWNNELAIGASLAHLFTGDYYKFLDDQNNETGTKNMYLIQFSLGMTF